MSHNWNHRQQRQEQTVELPEEENRYPHVHNQQPQNHLVPMSKCEVAELTWENGQLAMHRLGNNLPNEQAKHTWERASDTLESVVHQATNCQMQNLDLKGSDKNKANINKENIVKQETIGGMAKKRMRSDSDPQLYGISGRLVGEFHKNIFDQNAEPSASASVRDTVMTWPNYHSLDESSRSFKSKVTFNEDSACHIAGLENKEEERETKGSNTLRRSRTAAVHNQSERVC
nr:PREDICTED: transcription factor PIF7-like [Nicotiana tabacum]